MSLVTLCLLATEASVSDAINYCTPAMTMAFHFTSKHLRNIVWQGRSYHKFVTSVEHGIREKSRKVSIGSLRSWYFEVKAQCGHKLTSWKDTAAGLPHHLMVFSRLAGGCIAYWGALEERASAAFSSFPDYKCNGKNWLELSCRLGQGSIIL